MLTNDNLLFEGSLNGGTQRVYRYANGCGLSLVNSTILHPYPFAWEAAVLRNVSENGAKFELTYDTELTDDVIVFHTEEMANEFIKRAERVLSAL